MYLFPPEEEESSRGVQNGKGSFSNVHECASRCLWGKNWTSDQRVRHKNMKITALLPSVTFRVASPLLLVVCVGEVVKLGRGMWMRPTMLGCSSATIPSRFSSSSSSPLSHALLSDGYSYVLLRLDSLKEILSCKRQKQKN